MTLMRLYGGGNDSDLGPELPPAQGNRQVEGKVKVIIETIDHDLQRYDTCGDWQWQTGTEKDVLKISVSRLYNFRYEFLIGIHEWIEAVLCSEQLVKAEDVDAFDKSFQGPGEPGDSLLAPYHKQHLIATAVEQYLSTELGIDWNDYGRVIKQLEWRNPKPVNGPCYCQWCGFRVSGPNWGIHKIDCPRPKS